MFDVLQSGDGALFHFINLSLRNPVLDKLMPLASDTPGFVPLLLLVLMALIWRGGARGRLCAVLLLLGLCVGDGLVANTIKHGVGRLRPFNAFPDAHVLGGKTDSPSMPSSHALNWFCGMTIAFIFYRRSVYYLLPLALIVSFSRIYNGMHYPSDVLAGAVLGAGCGAALVWSADRIWQWSGRRWFPLWHAQLPSLLQPGSKPLEAKASRAPATSDQDNKQWLYLGYVLIAVLVLSRLGLLASGKIELSEDEAYQWLWSKHLAWSYYSKPLLIACAQFVGTHLWGDNEFGVRFFSPLITAITSVLVLRFLSREVNGRVAFLVVLALSVAPLTSLGAVVMTVDPLSVLFWTAAMLAGWRAAQPEGTTRQWLWVGLWMGLGFLSKYTNLFQWICWGLFFILWPPARRQLRRPGPWLALAIAAVCLLPVLIWNSQHDWITVKHVASDGRLGVGARWERTFTADFLLAEFGLLNPVFFPAALWAALAFWRRGRNNALQLYLFSMGAPLFLFYLLFTLYSRVEYNWIAPSVLPLFCLMAVYWDTRWPSVRRAAQPLLATGLGLGLVSVVLMHDPALVAKILHRSLPAQKDPLRRVLGWNDLALFVGQQRQELEKRAGKPTFIICEHYGFTSQITFYLPEAKSRVLGDPLVFCYASDHPINQFSFWPNYLGRTGQNALYVREAESPKFRPGWLRAWWNQSGDLFLPSGPPSEDLPRELTEQFTSITDLGVKDIVTPGKGVLRRVQIFACSNLR